MKCTNKFLAILWLLSLILCFSSCDKTDTSKEIQVKVESWSDEIITSDPEGANYDYYFASIKDLLYALKREPDKYNGVKVKVIGTMQLGYEDLSYEARLVDFIADSTNISSDGVLGRYNFNKTLDSSSSKVNIIISNDAQFSVAETGDLVKLYGIVSITRDSICINNCEYNLIADLDERKQNVSQQTVK